MLSVVSRILQKKKKNSVHDNDIHVYTFIHLLYATSNVCV